MFSRPPWQAAQNACVTSSVGRHGVGVEQLLDAIAQTERGGLPERRACPALDQPASRLPLPERRRVGERRAAADHRSARLDVGAGVEQGVERRDVVAAGGPVQRCLGVRAASKAGVDVGSGSDEGRDDGGAVGMVPGPVRRDVQERARHAARVDDPGPGKARVLGEQPLERGRLAGADRGRCGDGERIAGVEAQRTVRHDCRVIRRITNVMARPISGSATSSPSATTAALAITASET